jgi:hypothetical protein
MSSGSGEYGFRMILLFKGEKRDSRIVGGQIFICIFAMPNPSMLSAFICQEERESFTFRTAILMGVA